MRIGIVTFHFVNNFGGALQAYALQRAIQANCDAEAVVVDYQNLFIRFTDTIRLLPITSNVKEFFSGWKSMYSRFERLDKFKKFLTENLQLTNRYYNQASLKRNPPDCDKFVCGSDQIWNTAITFVLAEPYFLTFEQESSNKFSYAPSFGNNQIKARYEKKMAHYIGELNQISVRESDGVELAERLTGRQAIQLIDPVFLLTQEEWSEIAVTPSINVPYILLYIMQRDENVYNYAKQIKKRLGIKLIEISRYGYKPDFVDVSLINIGPAEFLGLFQNAAYVCTNSYHGLSFSLLFSKEFCFVPCKRFSSRITSLFTLLDIELPEANNPYLAKSVVYDKTMIKKIICSERQKSITYLQKNICGERTASYD